MLRRAYPQHKWKLCIKTVSEANKMIRSRRLRYARYVLQIWEVLSNCCGLNFSTVSGLWVQYSLKAVNEISLILQSYDASLRLKMWEHQELEFIRNSFPRNRRICREERYCWTFIHCREVSWAVFHLVPWTVWDKEMSSNHSRNEAFLRKPFRVPSALQQCVEIVSSCSVSIVAWDEQW